MFDSIISAILGAIFGAFCTIGIVDVIKRHQKRKLLLQLLKMKLEGYIDQSDLNSIVALTIKTRPRIIWDILASDILHPKKERELITELYELASWMEAHNNISDSNNLAILLNSPYLGDLTEKMNHYSYQTYKQVQKVRKLL